MELCIVTRPKYEENLTQFLAENWKPLEEAIAKGVRVTPIVDHEWMKSIYFKDPNGLLLEYACWTRQLADEDAIMQVRFTISTQGRSPVLDFRDQ